MKSSNLITLALSAILVLLLTLLGLQLGEHPWRQDGQAASGRSHTPLLKVLTRNMSTAYYLEQEQPAGPEYELVSAFAEFIGMAPEIIVKDSIQELLGGLQAGDGQLAAAAITRTDTRQNSLIFGPTYQTVQQQVLCHRDAPRPAAPADLVGRGLTIIANSSYAETLNTWQQQHADLAWEETQELSTEQILEHVAAGRVDCTLADSNIVAVNQRFLPELTVAFSASEPQPLAWVLRDKDGHLARQLDEWMARPETKTLVATILHRYYGHIDRFDYVDNNAYRRRIDSRLPRYRALFEAIAKNHDLPWTLVAAQAYQESHWDTHAKSPTGVRGLMMLTERTAVSVGVKDRLDPAQSIYGGVRYLKRMLARLPDSIQPADRLWFALAAYNIGMGHVEDARTLAGELRRDPDSWYDVERTLPLLSQQRHFKRLRYGYARGSEAVRYVRRIRNYHAVLDRSLTRRDQGRPSL